MVLWITTSISGYYRWFFKITASFSGYYRWFFKITAGISSYYRRFASRTTGGSVFPEKKRKEKEMENQFFVRKSQKLLLAILFFKERCIYVPSMGTL